MHGTLVRSTEQRRVINISTFQFHTIIVSDKRKCAGIARSIDSNRRDVQIDRTIGCWQIVG